MIIGRKFSYDKDLTHVNNILKENDIFDNVRKDDLIYVLEVNNEVIGACKVYIEGNLGVLKYLVISNDNRGENLGDGLLRATLNYCLKIGISKIYYPYINEYLVKKGFNIIYSEYNLNNSLNNLLDITKGEYLLVCHLNSFFEKECSCRRR